jgi:hypothetical protein
VGARVQVGVGVDVRVAVAVGVVVRLPFAGALSALAGSPDAANVTRAASVGRRTARIQRCRIGDANVFAPLNAGERADVPASVCTFDHGPTWWRRRGAA